MSGSELTAVQAVVESLSPTASAAQLPALSHHPLALAATPLWPKSLEFVERLLWAWNSVPHLMINSVIFKRDTG